MVRLESLLLRRWAVGVLSALACLLIVLLVWLGYVAVRAWQESLRLLADRQAEEAGDRVLAELTRDMQAVQRLVLLSPALDAFTSVGTGPDPSYGAVNLVASAFARYSYPEVFFLWRRDGGGPIVFSRRDRPVRGLESGSHGPFPVIVDEQSGIGRALIDRIAEQATSGRRFVAFESPIEGSSYQVVARLLYRDVFRQHLDTVFGFTVNLDWARRHYFPALVDEMVAARRGADGVAIAIADQTGETVAGDRQASGEPASERTFPVMFFNPLIVAADPPGRLERRWWTIRAVTSGDSSLLAASADADRLLLLGLTAATMLAVGIVLSVRAARTRLRLAELRSDFVASVTHEFKTPIATIRAAGETLAAGRLETAADRQAYAGFIVQESRRLARLVDNLLAFSRATDAPETRPPLEPVRLRDVVAETVDRFSVQLAGGSSRVDVAVPDTLPPVLGDRTGLALVLDNLVDNAVRHSRRERSVSIRARAAGRSVVLEVADRGGGIPQDEVGHVTKKFYRGRLAGHGGTGLGLAIAARIVADHRGTLEIDSEAGVGTTMRITLPAAVVSAPAPPPSGAGERE